MRVHSLQKEPSSENTLTTGGGPQRRGQEQDREDGRERQVHLRPSGAGLQSSGSLDNTAVRKSCFKEQENKLSDPGRFPVKDNKEIT